MTFQDRYIVIVTFLFLAIIKCFFLIFDVYVSLDQHVQKYFKSPPKSPEQSLHRRQGICKVNRPVPQVASSYLAAANPNLSKRRDKVYLFFKLLIEYNKTPLYLYIYIYFFFIRILEYLGMIVVIIQTSQQIVLNQVVMYPKVDQYQTIKIVFQIQNFVYRVRTHCNKINITNTNVYIIIRFRTSYLG